MLTQNYGKAILTTGWTKNWQIFVYALTSSNINQRAK